MPDTATFKQFAGIARCRPGYVTQLRQAGRLVLTDDGKRVRVTESLQLIEETRDPAKAAVVARHASNRAKGGKVAAAASGMEASDLAGDAEAESLAADDADAYTSEKEGSYGYWRKKAAREDFIAKQRENRKADGELLEATDVDQALQAAATTFRTSLENLPSTLAPELAAATDEGRVRVLLQEAIEHALEEISRQFAALGKVEA